MKLLDKYNQKQSQLRSNVRRNRLADLPLHKGTWLHCMTSSKSPRQLTIRCWRRVTRRIAREVPLMGDSRFTEVVPRLTSHLTSKCRATAWRPVSLRHSSRFLLQAHSRACESVKLRSSRSRLMPCLLSYPGQAPEQQHPGLQQYAPPGPQEPFASPAPQAQHLPASQTGQPGYMASPGQPPQAYPPAHSPMPVHAPQQRRTSSGQHQQPAMYGVAGAIYPHEQRQPQQQPTQGNYDQQRAYHAQQGSQAYSQPPQTQINGVPH